MSKIEINTGNYSTREIISQIEADADNEGFNLTITRMQNGNVMIEGEYDDLANFICDECFRECFLSGASTKEVKAQIR